MLSIDKNNNISLTRGDTMTLTLELKKDGQPYAPDAGDVIRFALSSEYMTDTSYEFILEKNVPLDTLTFTLTSEQTKLPYKDFNYDIQVTHEDGTVDTFISAKLTITGEVK